MRTLEKALWWYTSSLEEVLSSVLESSCLKEMRSTFVAFFVCLLFSATNAWSSSTHCTLQQKQNHNSGVASYLIQFISHTLNYHISYTLKPTFISHTKYKLRVQYRIHFLLFRRSRFISHTSVNFYAKFLQRSIFHANGPKRPIVSRARLLLGSRGQLGWLKLGQVR